MKNIPLIRSLTLIFLLFALLLSACSSLVNLDDSSNQISINPDNSNKQIEEESINENSDENLTIAEAENKDSEVNIIFMGDVMMDSFIADYINENGVDYPWTDVSPILNEADLSIANLETSVSNRGTTKKPEGFGFRSQPFTLEGLKNSGIDIVSVANNHILDFGEEALADTLTHLDEYGIRYVGAGKNIAEAENPVIIEENGIKLGFISYSSIIPWESWKATENSAGVASFTANDYEQLLSNIRAIDAEVDVLTVILHWGTEYESIPKEWQTELAHLMIDNGADVVVGHHPHVLQGIEFYKEKPILYSIGNFVFLKKNDQAGYTGMFELVLTKDGFKEGHFYPVNIKYTKANLLSSDDELGKKIILDLQSLSKAFGTLVEENGNFYPLD